VYAGVMLILEFGVKCGLYIGRQFLIRVIISSRCY